MKKLVIGGAAIPATAGIGLGLTQLANADSYSPKPTKSSDAPVVTGQAGNQQGSSMDGQHGGPGGGMMGLRGVDTTTLAQKLGVEESKLDEMLWSIQQSQGPGGASGQGKPSGNGTGQAAEDGQGQPPAVPPDESGLGDKDSEIVRILVQVLGLDESTATTATQGVRTKANKKVLDQAVSEGKLTQAEADAVAKAATVGIVEIRDVGSGLR